MRDAMYLLVAPSACALLRKIGEAGSKRLRTARGRFQSHQDNPIKAVSSSMDPAMNMIGAQRLVVVSALKLSLFSVALPAEYQ